MKRTLPKRHAVAGPQRGAASLIVVMVLFFVLSLAAAYTSRNLIFEQKTSANQYRSTMAFEAADAGVDWALTMLNGGTVNDSCVSTAGAKSFAERYLTIADTNPAAPDNGHVTQTARAGSWPTCVFNGAGWTCSCPDDTTVNPAAPVAGGLLPAFRVWLMPTVVGRTHIASLQSNGCTKLPASVAERCLDQAAEGDLGDGIASITSLIALRSGIQNVPASAVTAREALTLAAGAARLRAINTDLKSSGVTVNAGGAINAAQVAAVTIPGTPPAFSIVPSDPGLALLSNVALPTTPPAPPALTAGERMFVWTFGMKRDTYRLQSGLRECASPCSATNINALLAANPNRIIWAEGNVTLDADIGTAAEPVLLIVNGDTLTLGAGVDIKGFVYLTGGASATSTINLPSSPTSLDGAIVAEGGLTTAYGGAPAATDEFTVTYDPVLLNRLKMTYGTWVRVGGSWRDYR